MNYIHEYKTDESDAPDQEDKPKTIKGFTIEKLKMPKGQNGIKEMKENERNTIVSKVKSSHSLTLSISDIQSETNYSVTAADVIAPH